MSLGNVSSLCFLLGGKFVIIMYTTNYVCFSQILDWNNKMSQVPAYRKGDPLCATKLSILHSRRQTLYVSSIAKLLKELKIM